MSQLLKNALCLGGRDLAMKLLLVVFTLTGLGQSQSVQPATRQQQVTLRIVDFRTGKPLNVYLTIDAWNGKWERGEINTDTNINYDKYRKGHDGMVVINLPTPQSRSAPVVFEASTKTDKDGILVIRFMGAPPERIRIASFELHESVPELSVAETLRAGAVCRYQAFLPLQNIRSKPGEVVIFNRKVSRADKLRRELP